MRSAFQPVAMSMTLNWSSWVVRGSPWNELANEPASMYGMDA
jgi:hypothetical protein